MSPKYEEFPRHLDRIIGSALEAVSPDRAVRRYLSRDQGQIWSGDKSFDLGSGSVYVVAVGKASVKMASAAVEILGSRLKRGIVITKASGEAAALDQENLAFPPNIEVHWAGHPVSDWRGVQATAATLDMLADTIEEDLVLCLISGGTSALLTKPVIPLEDWQLLVSAMLESGCTINELNAVRRRIDLVKGGGLLDYTAPARCVSLILSDVVGNPLEVIGSGPTVPAVESRNLARQVLERYCFSSILPTEVVLRLDQALGEKEGAVPSRVSEVANIIIGDVCEASRAACRAAQEIGLSVQVLTCHLEGEAREVGRVAAALAKDLEPGSCLILGGETTVTVRGSGLGGRNQELVLAAAIAIDGLENTVIASFSTDGDDGPTNAAGAYCTGDTCSRARGAGQDPQRFLDENDSYNFFTKTGDLLVTGPTGTNVNDLLIIIRYAE